MNATQQMASIVEFYDDAIISKDLDRHHHKLERGVPKALFGYIAEDVIGKPMTMLIPPDRLDEEPKIIERIRRGGRVEHYETVRQRKDGSKIDVSLTISPVKNAEGKIVGASKIARDITERKRTQSASRRPGSRSRAPGQEYTSHGTSDRSSVAVGHTGRAQACNRRAHPGARERQLAVCRVALDGSRAAHTGHPGACRLLPGGGTALCGLADRTCFWSLTRRRRLP